LVGGSDYDQVVSSGSSSLGGMTLTLSATNVQEGDLFFILLNGGTAAVNGYFVDANGTLGQGQNFSAGGCVFTISYTGDGNSKTTTGGNDVVLAVVAIPEPHALNLAGAAAVVLFLVKSSRRKSLRPRVAGKPTGSSDNEC